jgi:hypothetical protein
MNNWCICWFFTYILLRISIFKGLTGRRLYKPFCFKALNTVCTLILGHTFVPGIEMYFRTIIERDAIYFHSYLLCIIWRCPYSDYNHNLDGRNSGSRIGNYMEGRDIVLIRDVLPTLMKKTKPHTHLVRCPWWISYRASSTVCTVGYRFIKSLG